MRPKRLKFDVITSSHSLILFGQLSSENDINTVQCIVGL